MVYKWKTGFYKTPPSVAAGVMEELTRSGGLTAKTLVDASRPADAPLHDEFEWNDSTAAELYRQEQARGMIQSIVIINDEKPQQEKTRAFVHIRQESSSAYEPIEVVIRDEDKLEFLYKEALRELNSFREKYKNIKAFEALIREIDKLSPEVTGA